MSQAPRKKRVHAERLRELGFGEDEIAEALEYEKGGGLDIEPPPGMLASTMAALEPLYPKKEPAPEDDPWKEAIRVLISDLVASVKVSNIQPLMTAVRELVAQKLEGNSLKVVHGLPFALKEHKRPLVILENHNLIDPNWFAADDEFRSLSYACKKINEVARTAGVEPCAQVVVLRPDVSDYSTADTDAIYKLLQKATSDVWWLPKQKAGGLAGQDIVVIGDQEMLALECKASSAHMAMQAMNAVEDPTVVTMMRQRIEHVIAQAQPIKQKGHLMIKDFGITSEGGKGVRELLGKVIAETKLKMY